MNVCLFCGGNRDEPDHLLLHCDGRQGWVEDFDGETYQRPRDHERLFAQLQRVFAVMRDGQWRTLEGVSAQTTDPQASISARLRDLRKEKFGGHLIERRYIEGGLWEYRLVVPVAVRAS